MKEKNKNIIIIILTLILLILIFLNRLLVMDSVLLAFNLWLQRIFPTLFIMFIIQDFLINYNLTNYLHAIFGKNLKLFFRLSKNAQTVFILSLITGMPSAAYVINKLYNDGKILKKEAENLLYFTYFPNPLFLYNMLMLIFLNNLITLKIILIFYLSNFIIAFFMRFNNSENLSLIYNTSKEKFAVLLVKSIRKSMDNIILILGTITFFMIISNVVTSFFSNQMILTFIKGFFEITQGLDSLKLLDSSLKLKEIIAILIISFGGISIHVQVFSMIYESNIKFSSFIKGRIISSIISLILIIIF